MKLGLGLDVRKASAPAFKGLLDKFTGAVAAYSTRKLTASQPNTLPADYGDGAAAAYSLRKVKASYSGNCIDVRRSSDNTTSSIGFSGNELDTTALEAFVNEDITQYNYSTATQMVADFQTVKGAISVDTIGGQEALKFTVDTASGTHFAYRFGIFGGGGECSISFDYYIPSTNTDIDGIQMNDSSNDIGATQTIQDAWTSATVTGTLAGDALYIYSLKATSKSYVGNGTDVFYIKNLVVTQTTADGFVTKWYDQSGNENDAVDATQATDNDQPQIVDAGSTILENGKPAIQFDGVDDFLSNTLSSTIPQPTYWFVTHNFHATPSAFDGVIGNFSTDTEHRLILDGSLLYSLQAGGSIKYNSYQTSQSLVSYKIDASDERFYFNGSEQTASGGAGIGSAGLESIILGALNETSGHSPIQFQEIILFDTDQSANRQDIEWNINNHYNIYTDSWDKQSAMEVRRAIDNETTNIGFVGKDLDTTALEAFATESSPVLDDYTGAAAAYSLRKVRSAYTGSAIRVRRSSDDELQDIGFDSNGDLDTTALTTFVNEEITDDINTTTDSNSDGLADGLTSSGNGTYSIVTGNGHIGSAQRLDYNTGGSSLQSIRTNTLSTMIGQEITISFMYRSNITWDWTNGASGVSNLSSIPANTGNAIRVTQKAIWNPTSGSDGVLLTSWAQNAGEFIEISDWSVTYHTADGAVTTWYDQSVPTETYDSDFSSGVDGFTATNPSNNTVTRLASVTDDYSTTVENVLQFEAATAGTGITQQLRNNLGLTVGGTYKVSFKMLIDSGNSPDGLVRAGLYDGAGSTPEDIPFGGKLTETGRWTTFTDVPVTQGNARLFFAGLDSSDSLSFDSVEGDKFYIADVSVDEVNDATQTTDNDQPLVVSGGTLVEENGKAAIQFDGVDDWLDAGLSSSQFSQAFVVKNTTGTGTAIAYSGAVELESLRYNTSDDDITFSSHSGLYTIDNLNVKGYLNGVDETGAATTFTQTFNRLYLGSINGAGSFIDGKIQEYIHFPYASDQSSNRTGIEGNIGRYYNIDGFRDVFVSKWFDQSGNFNHAENSTDTEQPQIVDGGTLVADTDGDASIYNFVDGSLVKGLIPSYDQISSQNYSLFVVAEIDSSSDKGMLLGDTSSNSNFIYASDQGNSNSTISTNYTNINSFIDSATFTPTTRDDVHTGMHTDAPILVSAFYDTSTTFSGTSNYPRILGYFNDTNFMAKNKIKEWILFESDQSANRTDIESNINKHFKIYE